MIDQPASFDGASFQQWRDGERLQRQLSIIRTIMSDYEPHTLDTLAAAAGCSTASASARVRDLRKAKFGGYRVTRTWLGGGVWSYCMVAASAVQA
jgi:hypothetical protein